jgi:very-short-patch-repair endonuclease
MSDNSKKFPQKSSPPWKGGVSEGRGGSQDNKPKSLDLNSNAHIQAQPPPAPPLEGGELVTENLTTPPNVKKQVKKKINNLPHLKTFRKNLRNNLTPAEARFWKAVQNKNLEGRKFRRQHSVGNYILDFYCPAEKLAVELDGEVHFSDAARDYDRKRRLYLENCGIRVLRFENRLVFEDLEWVLGVTKSNFGWNETTTPSETTPSFVTPLL